MSTNERVLSSGAVLAAALDSVEACRLTAHNNNTMKKLTKLNVTPLHNSVITPTGA